MEMEKRLKKEQEEIKKASKDLVVAKSNRMIQKSRISLTAKEQKCVTYAISKIKPDDKNFKWYELDLNEFYTLCGIKNKSFTRVKSILDELSNKSWYLLDPDGTMTQVRWFNKIRLNPNKGVVEVRFDDDMMPYLLNLPEQARENGDYYTQYMLKYVMPMKSMYSMRLYEILQSFLSNNDSWFFDIDELKEMLDCTNYENWKDFRKRVLEPAIKEMSETDLNVSYDVEKKGRKVVKVIFYIKPKEILQQEKSETDPEEKTDLEQMLEKWNRNQQELMAAQEE